MSRDNVKTTKFSLRLKHLTGTALRRLPQLYPRTCWGQCLCAASLAGLQAGCTRTENWRKCFVPRVGDFSGVHLTAAPLDLPAGRAGRSGATISQAGLAVLGKGKYLAGGSSPCSSVVWPPLSLWLPWLCTARQAPSAQIWALQPSGPEPACCPVPGSAGKGLRLPKCTWETSGPVSHMGKRMV